MKIKAKYITKLVEELPENFEALKKTVKATMCGQHEKLDQLLEGDQFTICFFDNMRCSVIIADDQKLNEAYETAKIGNRRILKFFIDPLPGTPLASIWDIDSKTTQKSKGHTQRKTKDGEEKYNWRKHVKELSVDKQIKK